MTKQELLTSIKNDLGVNYYDDSTSTIIGEILDEVINDALFVSNRRFKVDPDDETSLEPQLDILGSNIRRAVKSIYLQRGSEDVSSTNQSGISSNFDDVMQKMRDDIIKGGKRILV